MSGSMNSAGTPALDPDRHLGQDLQTIPRYVQFTSPVSLAMEYTGRVHAQTLPLNLIAHIVSYLDDIGDIARVTRSSRLLHYMTLPQLYQRVSLHSYPDIRYVRGRPEGYGSGSPFIMALNGLAAKGHAGFVHELRLWGEWRELAPDDYSKGRVPDNDMMLNILLRVAIDRMSKLRSVAWELNCKPLKTLYQGLSLRSSLTSLTVKFPLSREPRPVVIMPPMPNLRALRISDIDPLCYPDDFSLLLLHSPKLEDLRMHFSPRMRAEAESSLNLDTYFGRCHKANYKLPLKHLGVQNWYGPRSDAWGENGCINLDTCQSVSFLDVFGGSLGGVRNAYIDSTWDYTVTPPTSFFRSCRTNEMSPAHVAMIGNESAAGMERLYFVSARLPKATVSPQTPENQPTPDTPREYPVSVAAVGREYISVLKLHQRDTLRHLLLSDQWTFSSDELKEIVCALPRLEQLGLALETPDLDTLCHCIASLPKLVALRLHHNDALSEYLRAVPQTEIMAHLGRELYRVDTTHTHPIRWLGLGRQVYRIGNIYRHTLENGQDEMRKEVIAVNPEDVGHVQIWGLDNLDLGSEPLAPFTT